MDYITDTTTDALNRLLEQYKRKTKFKSYISSFIQNYQQLEDIVFQLLTKFNLDTITGIQLDNFGKIVGQTRIIGQSDDEYRLFIKGRILINISDGTPEKIIQLVKLLSGATQVILIEYFPAAISISINTTIATNLVSIFKSLIKNATSAGVSIDFITTHNNIKTFSYKGTVTTGKAGYSSILSHLTGGGYAGVL